MIHRKGNWQNAPLCVVLKVIHIWYMIPFFTEKSTLDLKFAKKKNFKIEKKSQQGYWWLSYLFLLFVISSDSVFRWDYLKPRPFKVLLYKRKTVRRNFDQLLSTLLWTNHRTREQLKILRFHWLKEVSKFHRTLIRRCCKSNLDGFGLGAIFILRKGILMLFWTTHPPT